MGFLVRLFTVTAIGFSTISTVFSQQELGWPAYLGDQHSSQYSSLDQINKNNVKHLRRAWEYHTGEAGQMQCNAVVIERLLYCTTTSSTLFALDAVSGEEIWRFDPDNYPNPPQGFSNNRGVVFWADGEDQRVLYSAGHLLFAVDALTGELISNFGNQGAVNLKEGLGRPVDDLFVVSNTPGVVFNNLLIMGSRVSEANPAAPGHIRAYDIRRGELVWIFHTVPQPGEYGYETWPQNAWDRVGGANAWAGMSLDADLGIVYVPTGSASFDFYGGDRPGRNLFANTLLALDAASGERIWHFQMVHHDIWDRDLPAPPNLLNVNHDGRTIQAVAQITKSGHVFLFDRKSGEPLFPIEEQPFPASDLPGEWTSPTQPIPVKPPVFAREYFDESQVTTRTPEAHEIVLNQLRRYRSAGPFIPPSKEGTIVLPGFDGGGEWGGAAVDPDRAIMYVNNSEMAWILTMIELNADDTVNNPGQFVYANNCLVCHGVEQQGDPLGEYPSLQNLHSRMSREDVLSLVRSGRNMMPSFQHLEEETLVELIDYLFARTADNSDSTVTTGEASVNLAPNFRNTGYIRFLDPDGFPALKPPWGQLSAIDLNAGELLWQVPLGKEPGLETIDGIDTGTENYGGPVVTAGGLVFIAASKDSKIRAFDAGNGSLLWEANLPFAGFATPSVYMVEGKQYIVIAAGGGKVGVEAGDSYVAFALPE